MTRPSTTLTPGPIRLFSNDQRRKKPIANRMATTPTQVVHLAPMRSSRPIGFFSWAEGAGGGLLLEKPHPLSQRPNTRFEVCEAPVTVLRAAAAPNSVQCPERNSDDDRRGNQPEKEDAEAQHHRRPPLETR